MFYAIGDIHGEAGKLKQLVGHITDNDHTPIFLFIGDFIDKGPESKSVLDYLSDLARQFEVHLIMGNHDYFWLNIGRHQEAVQFLKKYGGQETLASFNSDNFYDTRQILTSTYPAIFKKLKPYHIHDKYIFTHSGIDPKNYITPPEQLDITDFLFNRYDFISHMSLYLNKYIIVFGHTGFYFPYVDPYKIGIDTAAVYLKTQPLTAFCLEKQFFIDSNNRIQPMPKQAKQHMCPSIVRLTDK